MLVLVVFSLKPVKHLGPYKRTQHCWPTTRKNVVTCCVRLHGPLEYERTYRGVNPDPWRWMRAGGRGGGGGRVADKRQGFDDLNFLQTLAILLFSGEWPITVSLEKPAN